MSVCPDLINFNKNILNCEQFHQQIHSKKPARIAFISNKNGTEEDIEAFRSIKI